MDRNKFEIFKKKIDQLMKHYNAGNYQYVLRETHILNKKYPENSFLANLSGSCLQKMGQLEMSKKFFNFAIKIENTNLAAINNLGNSHRLLFEFEEAEKCFNKVLDKNPNHIQSLVNLGNLRYELNNLNEAIELFEKALTLDKNLVLAHYNAGLTYQSLGNHTKATYHYNIIQELQPKITIVDRQMSRMIKYNKQESHLNIMLNKLEKLDLDQHSKVDLNFAIGKAYEDMNDYNKSFFYIERANNIKNSLLNFDVQKDIKLSKDLVDNFINTIQNNSNTNNKEKKLVFIVGLPRSGTSLIEQIISSHSNVYGGGELIFLEILLKRAFTENNKFIKDKLADDKIFQNVSDKFYDHIRKFYDGKKNIITDKTPQNFMWIGLIKKIFPEAKFIHSIRNPKDNCLSIYKNLFDGDINWSYNLDNILKYFENYRYIISKYKSEFDKDILDIKYEDLIENPENKIKKILNFCELDFEDACLNFYNNKRAIKTLSISQARQPMYKSSIGTGEKFESNLKDFFIKLNSI